MPYSTYRAEPLTLWPPEAADDHEQLTQDTPTVGVTLDDLGLWTAHGNYIGTDLIVAVDAPESMGWETHSAGFLFVAGRMECGPTHPDLVALLPVLRNVYHSLDEAPPRLATLDALLDTSVDFLVKRGWVVMVPTFEDQDYDTAPTYWRRA